MGNQIGYKSSSHRGGKRRHDFGDGIYYELLEGEVGSRKVRHIAPQHQMGNDTDYIGVPVVINSSKYEFI